MDSNQAPTIDTTSPLRGEDLTGKVFSFLTVIRYAGRLIERNGGANKLWECKCICGALKSVRAGNLKSGETRSCGCYQKSGDGHATHRSTKTPLYVSWMSMRSRCYNPRTKCYPNYGGRGIRVCDRWRNSFETFREDMAPTWKPGLTIERKDVNGDYEPSNCVWATRKEQNNNTRANRVITFRGETRNLTQWAAHLGVRYALLSKRLRLGWTEERTLGTPVYPTGQYQCARNRVI